MLSIPGDFLDCYKCPVEIKDMLYCSDPYEDNNFRQHCDDGENVCLKISVRGEY